MTDEEKEIKLVTERCPCCGTKVNPKKIKDTCENCLETCFDQWRHKVADLEKENADLKVQIELYSEKVRYWEEQSKLKESQLEEQDRQAFFTAAKFDELKAQIEKMKNCENCKYNCKEDGEEYCDSPNGVCKRYSTTFDKDNWELAE